MKKFTTILAAASLMLAGLASCNEPGPQPQPEPPVPEATWDEQVGTWLEGTDFTGELPLPVEQLQDLIVDVAEAEGKIKVTIDDLGETVPEPEEGEELPEGTQPRDYYTVFADVLSFAYYNYVYDDEDGDQDEGSMDVLTKFDADGDFANLHVEFSSPWTFFGFEIPGYVELTWDVEKAYTAEETLTAINEFIEDNGVENSDFLKEGEDLTSVGSFFRLEEFTYNAYEEAIAEVADVIGVDYDEDAAGDFYTSFLWNYASKTTEAQAASDIADLLIDELNYTKTMETPATSIDQKGNQFTYLTMSEGPYNRVDLRIVTETIDYMGQAVIAAEIYAMPKDKTFDGEVTEAIIVKTFSKPEGPGVVPAEDALLNVLDVEAEGAWTYTAKYKGVGNIIETKAKNAAGDSINGNFYEMYDQLRIILQVETASEANTEAVTKINNWLGNYISEGVGFKVAFPDLTEKEPTGLNVKVTTYTDHEGEKTFILDYNDYYPHSPYDPEDTKTYAERWVELLAEQTFIPEGESEAVAAWTEPEKRTTTSGVEYYACYGVERITVGEGMDAKEKRVNLQWVAGSASFRLIVYVDDAPAAWDVAAMNKLVSDAGFTTVVPHVEGEYFFNLDQYLEYGQFVVYAPDNDQALLGAFVEQFVCLEPNEDEAEGLALREPEAEPEWYDESFVSSGTQVYDFVSIETKSVGGIPVEYDGLHIEVQAYNQGGLSYFIVEITDLSIDTVGAYLEDSLGALGWVAADEGMDMMYDLFYTIEVSTKQYGGEIAVLANQPYDPVEENAFIFNLAFQAPDMYDLNDVYTDVMQYYVDYSIFTLFQYGSSHNPTGGIYDYMFALTDNNGEWRNGTALKYGYFRFICNVNTLQTNMIWYVTAPNQNQELDLADVNRTFEYLGSELRFGDASALGEIFAHDYIDEYYTCNVQSLRVIDDFEVLTALIDAGFEIFNIEGVDVDLTGWDEETYTGTIVISVWADPEDHGEGTLFQLTITVVVSNTEEVATGETDPVSGEELTEEVPCEWKVTAIGGWAHLPQA